MALLRMPAIEALYRVIEECSAMIDRFLEPTCPTCGNPTADTDSQNAAIRALAVMSKTAQTVLDRCDVGPKATLEVKQSDGDFDLKMLTDDEKQRMMSALAEFKAVKEEARQRLFGTTTDTNTTIQ